MTSSARRRWQLVERHAVDQALADAVKDVRAGTKWATACIHWGRIAML